MSCFLSIMCKDEKSNILTKSRSFKIESCVWELKGDRPTGTFGIYLYKDSMGSFTSIFYLYVHGLVSCFK